MSVFEASAPTRIDLAGGTLDVWPLYLLHPGALALGVALDRRVSCRVSTEVNGVCLETKDTRARVEGRDLSEVLAKDGQGLVANVLRALGIETGIHVVTQARVPEGAGLGVSAALAVSVAAAATRALGRAAAPEDLWPVVRDAETRSRQVPTGILDYQTALLGGVVEVRLDAGRVRAQRLAADPSRVEEHLLLVESGAAERPSGQWEAVKRRIDGDPAATAALTAIASATQRLRGAFGDQRFADAAALLREEWAARRLLLPGGSVPEVERIVEIAAAHGGAARACGHGSAVAVWIAPEAREGLVQALTSAGARAVPIRADLRGLSVDGI